MVRAIRGATTADENTKELIFKATEEMVSKIIEKNNINKDDIIDFIFTITPDLNAVFPAAAVRGLGFTDVPLLDMAAPDINGALKKCIRVIVHINSEKNNGEFKHIYLKGAKALRPDLAK